MLSSACFILHWKIKVCLQQPAMFCLSNSNVYNFLPDLDMFFKSLGLYDVNEWLQRGPITNSNFDWVFKFDSYVKQENRKFHNQIFMQTYFATKENHTILIKSSNNFDQFLCLLWLVFKCINFNKNINAMHSEHEW